MNIKAWWSTAVNFVRKLPVAQYIKPIWKGWVKEIIQTQGAKGRELLIKEVAEDGPRAVDRNIDKWQRELIAALDKLPLPAWIVAPAKNLVQEGGDSFQEKLHNAVETGGPALVASTWDAGQAALLARVDAL